MTKSPDWSEEKYREMLIYQRKFMWREDSLDALAAFFNLKPGITVADIGCGLGFLGYTFWEYFKNGGFYIGVDSNLSLLNDAVKASTEWAGKDGSAFISGDAYNIPVDDNSVDLAICQTLLMHLQKPGDALDEMIRVVKPGGTVVCLEPDNLSSMLVKRNWSIPELDIDDLLLTFKVALLSNKGRIKLGLGDDNIGVQLTHLMAERGLKQIDGRLYDQIWYLEPPYEGEHQQHRLKIAERNMLDEEHTKYWREKNREQFLAGGGDPEEFERYIKISESQKPIIKEQLEKGTFYSCSSVDMYLVKGTKPE